jgi:hypothetical protein
MPNAPRAAKVSRRRTSDGTPSQKRMAREWWLECINPRCRDCKRDGSSRTLLREVDPNERRKRWWACTNCFRIFPGNRPLHTAFAVNRPGEICNPVWAKLYEVLPRKAAPRRKKG